MNGGIDDSIETDDSELQTDGALEETVVLTEEPVDNVGDTTAEFKVEELVAKLAKVDDADVEKKRAIRRRLDELQDEIGDQLDSTYNISLDDD